MIASLLLISLINYQLILCDVTVSPVPDPGGIDPTPAPKTPSKGISTVTLLFILAILLFLLVFIGWIVCQNLVKETAQRDNTEPLARDTKVNTISSAQSDVTVEPQTMRSEMLVKSPMGRAKADQKTESRVQMSRESFQPKRLL